VLYTRAALPGGAGALLYYPGKYVNISRKYKIKGKNVTGFRKSNGGPGKMKWISGIGGGVSNRGDIQNSYTSNGI